MPLSTEGQFCFVPERKKTLHKAHSVLKLWGKRWLENKTGAVRAVLSGTLPLHPSPQAALNERRSWAKRDTKRRALLLWAPADCSVGSPFPLGFVLCLLPGGSEHRAVPWEPTGNQCGGGCGRRPGCVLWWFSCHFLEFSWRKTNSTNNRRSLSLLEVVKQNLRPEKKITKRTEVEERERGLKPANTGPCFPGDWHCHPVVVQRNGTAVHVQRPKRGTRV